MGFDSAQPDKGYNFFLLLSFLVYLGALEP